MTTAQLDLTHPACAKIWALWDAGDLVSLHATEQGARDAREEHLLTLGRWVEEDQELLEAATQVLPMLLQAP